MNTNIKTNKIYMIQHSDNFIPLFIIGLGWMILIGGGGGSKSSKVSFFVSMNVISEGVLFNLKKVLHV